MNRGKQPEKDRSLRSPVTAVTWHICPALFLQLARFYSSESLSRLLIVSYWPSLLLLYFSFACMLSFFENQAYAHTHSVTVFSHSLSWNKPRREAEVKKRPCILLSSTELLLFWTQEHILCKSLLRTTSDPGQVNPKPVSLYWASLVG